MQNLEEVTKIAKDTKFAVLGRAIADAANMGMDVTMQVEEARILRKQEQDSAGKSTRFSALARQIGDAAWSGMEIEPIIERLKELRMQELGPDTQS